MSGNKQTNSQTKSRFLPRIRLENSLLLTMLVVTATMVTSIVTVFKQIDATGFDTRNQITEQKAQREQI